MSIYYYKAGYFNFINIFFDSDPSTVLASFAHGYGRHVVIHSFSEVFTVPIRLLTKVLYEFGQVGDVVKFREIIALSICPFFSTLTLFYYNKILDLLNIHGFDLFFCNVIFAFSFSNIIFAIIPENFAISGFFIAYIFYYYIFCKISDTSGNIYVWLLLAVFLSGVTITNISIFIIIYFFNLYNRKKMHFKKSFLLTCVYSLFCILSVVSFYYISHFILGINHGDEQGVNWFLRFASFSFFTILKNVANFFNAFVTSYIPILPDSQIFDSGHYLYNELAFTRFSRSFIDNLLFIIVLSFIVYIIYSLKHHLNDKRWSEVYSISLIIILYNLLLHSFFGREMFLYSQHWIIALSFVLVRILSGKRLLSVLFMSLLIVSNLFFFNGLEQLVQLSPK
jgi:hypothetical protein